MSESNQPLRWCGAAGRVHHGHLVQAAPAGEPAARQPARSHGVGWLAIGDDSLRLGTTEDLAGPLPSLATAWHLLVMCGTKGGSSTLAFTGAGDTRPQVLCAAPWAPDALVLVGDPAADLGHVSSVQVWRRPRLQPCVTSLQPCVSSPQSCLSSPMCPDVEPSARDRRAAKPLGVGLRQARPAAPARVGRLASGARRGHRESHRHGGRCAHWCGARVCACVRCQEGRRSPSERCSSPHGQEWCPRPAAASQRAASTPPPRPTLSRRWRRRPRRRRRF